MPKPSNYAKFFDVYLQQEIPEKYEGDISLTCPFDDCQKEEHFKANCDNGLWHCVKCDEGGNARALITKIHAQTLSHTTDAQWKLLASLRGIAWDILRDSGFAYDVSNDRWLVPYYTYDPVKEEFTDFLNNLGYFYPSSKDPKSQFVIKKAPQLPVYLYNPGIHYTPPLSSRSIVWEGEWDTLAYYDAVRDTPDLVLGKPGAGFPIATLETLSQCKELVLGLDNDMSGRKQTAVAIKTVQQGAPKLKLRVLDWSLVPEPPKDLRDLWTDKKRKGSMIKDISSAMVPYDEAEDELIDNPDVKVLTAGYVEDATVYPLITSFGTYIDKTKTRLHVTEETQLAMAATFAITTSIDLRGEPLWGFLRGPASSLDKDTVVKINRAGKTFDITIKKLYEMLILKKIRGGKSWNQDIPTTIQRRSDDNTIRQVLVADVIKSGTKVCFEVLTESGHCVTASKDHKFLTDRGWVRLLKLSLNDSLFVNNKERNCGESRRQSGGGYIYGLTYHPNRRQPYQGTRSKSRGRDRLLKHRIVYEAYLNDMSLEKYVNVLRTNEEQANTFMYLNDEDIIHHKDRNKKNNHLSNLERLDRSEHGKEHGEENTCNVLQKTNTSKIVSIKLVGIRETYDISVLNDPHNFLANGIVVHNSGKTTFIESFGGKNQWFDNLSKVTAESFVSGWRDETGDEPSFLPTLTDPIPKTLFIKDFTTTLMDTAEKQQKVFGLLTDIYDGHVKIHYGNNQTREFHNTYFNMVAGVTDILDAYSSASIGERFMRIDWLGRDYDPREYGRRALDNFGQTIDQKIALTEWTLGFVRHLRSLELSTTVEEMYKEPILDLADFISIVRTKVETDRYEGMKYKPRPELPSRLAKLLAKLFVSSRVVMGSSELAFKVVRKVAIDTCYGFPLDIVRFILANPNTVREEIAIGTNIHPQRAYRVITDLCTTGVLKQGLQTSTRKNGRKRHIFYINPKLLPALYPEAHLHDNQPATKQRRITSPNNSVRTGRSQPPRRNT